MNEHRPLVSAIKSHDGRVMLRSFECGPNHMSSSFTIPTKQARDLAAQIITVCDEIDREKVEQAAQAARNAEFDDKFMAAMAADEVGV